MMEMMQTVRGFINLIKANPTTREHYKSNKLATRKYDNKVNESEIHSNYARFVRTICMHRIW